MQKRNKFNAETKDKGKNTFPKNFPTQWKSYNGGHIPPYPPVAPVVRAVCGLLTQNASLSIHGTTTPKNLVSQIAFGKRFANSWFCFAKLKCSNENFKTRPHLNILPSAKYLFLLCKNRKRFFWGGRAVNGTLTDDGRKLCPTPYPLPTGGENTNTKTEAI